MKNIVSIYWEVPLAHFSGIYILVVPYNKGTTIARAALVPDWSGPAPVLRSLSTALS